MDSDMRRVISWNGSGVLSVKKSFKAARKLAGLDETVIPHSLRHTAATWLMQAGVEPWDAAGFLGMTVDMLVRNYGHQHPSYQADAADKIGNSRPHRNRTEITVRSRTESEQNAG